MNGTITSVASVNTFKLREQGQALILELQGSFGSLGWQELDELNRSVAESLEHFVPGWMVVDLSQSSYGGAEFLRFLGKTNKRIQAQGGQLVLAGVSDQMEQVLRVSKLDGRIARYDSLEAALDTLG